MSCLKDLTKNKNVIVLATIHQPNSNISSLFDDLMIMNKGECVYFGRFDDAVDRFNKVGLTCPIYNNPCDFFISIIDNDDNSQLLFNSQNNWFQSLCTDNFNNDNIDCENHELLYIKMIQSNKTELNSINNESNNNDINKENEAYATSFIHQSKILTIRSWRQWLRDPGMFMSELVQYSFLGFFLGGLYYNVNLKLESGVYDRTFSLFFLLAVLIFTPPFTAISTFALERSLFRKVNVLLFLFYYFYYYLLFIYNIGTIRQTISCIIMVISKNTYSISNGSYFMLRFLLNSLFISRISI